jgi:hypothetical protein
MVKDNEPATSFRDTRRVRRAIEGAIDGDPDFTSVAAAEVISSEGLSQADLEKIEASLGKATLVDPRLEGAREDIETSVYAAFLENLKPTPTPDTGKVYIEPIDR